MKKELLIYLAGLWDGEGSFMLVKTSTRNKKDPKDYSPKAHGQFFQIPINRTPTAQVCMTVNGIQENVMQIFKDNYDGVLHLIKNPPSKNKNGKPVLMWRATSRKATTLAKDLLPYLRIKKRQAEIIIRYGLLQEMNRHNGTRNITKEDIDERVLLDKKIRELNHRGLK